MQTQNTTQPNRQSPDEQVVFIEYSTVQKNQHFMTVMGKENGRRKIIARIFREFDPVLKQMKYTAKGRENEPVFPEITSLYELKKQFIEQAKQLARTVPVQEKSEPAIRLPEQKQVEEKGERKSIGEKIKDKAQEFTQSLVDSPMKEEGDPIMNQAIETMKKESELKEIRNEKGNGKAKGINR